MSYKKLIATLFQSFESVKVGTRIVATFLVYICLKSEKIYYVKNDLRFLW